jgi:hypothetical protein
MGFGITAGRTWIAVDIEMRRYPTSATILLTDGRKAGQVLISM